MAPRLSRSVQTGPLITPIDGQKILNAQRELRPTSPHLDIYQPQLTWYLSGLHRITGVAVGGLFYLGALAYAFHPLYPVIDSAHAIELIHNLPYWLKATGKVALAFPLTFHSFNGVRHLMWDLGKGECAGVALFRDFYHFYTNPRPYLEGCLHLWLRRACRLGALHDLPRLLRLRGEEKPLGLYW